MRSFASLNNHKNLRKVFEKRDFEKNTCRNKGDKGNKEVRRFKTSISKMLEECIKERR